MGRLLPLRDVAPPATYSRAVSRSAANCSASDPVRDVPVGSGSSTWMLGCVRLSALVHELQLSQPTPGSRRQLIAFASSRARWRLPAPSCPVIRTACGNRPVANQALICALARACPVIRSNDKGSGSTNDARDSLRSRDRRSGLCRSRLRVGHSARPWVCDQGRLGQRRTICPSSDAE